MAKTCEKSEICGAIKQIFWGISKKYKKSNHFAIISALLLKSLTKTCGKSEIYWTIKQFFEKFPKSMKNLNNHFAYISDLRFCKLCHAILIGTQMPGIFITEC